MNSFLLAMTVHGISYKPAKVDPDYIQHMLTFGFLFFIAFPGVMLLLCWFFTDKDK